ncbi:MAG: rhomboid family intramembrane serine protease [Gemmataceae bacterium]|nr:rhomboid family intramembrane serine protease [Gemmataceae bacterium]
MGFYDRDYMRDDGRSYVDSLVPQGRVTKWLIAINLIVFVFQLITQPRGLTEWLELVPSRVAHGEVWRLLSYAFVHDPNDFLHIAFNMLFLWWFGSDVEAICGSREFAWFYGVAAFIGGLAQTAYGYGAGHPMTPCVGASGAITAVLLLNACHFPGRSILVFGLLPVPIWGFVAFEVGRDAYVWLTGDSTRVAVTVHLAGAAFGYLYYRQQWKLATLDFFSRVAGSRGAVKRRPSLRVYHPEEEEREPIGVAAPTAPSLLDEHLEAKLDAALEKVARSGKDSLTDEEHRILLRASEIYRKRRS